MFPVIKGDYHKNFSGSHSYHKMHFHTHIPLTPCPHQATGDLTEGGDTEEALDNTLLDTCSHPQEQVEPILQQIYIPIA